MQKNIVKEVLYWDLKLKESEKSREAIDQIASKIQSLQNNDHFAVNQKSDDSKKLDLIDSYDDMDQQVNQSDIEYKSSLSIDIQLE